MGLSEVFDEAAYARKLVEELLRKDYIRESTFPAVHLVKEQMDSVKYKVIQKLKEKKLLWNLY